MTTCAKWPCTLPRLICLTRPASPSGHPAQLEQGRALVQQGRCGAQDSGMRAMPRRSHDGVAPSIPGLLGLP